MKRDLRSELEKLLARLEDQQFETCVDDIREELDRVTVDLKHLIDFTLPPRLSDTQQLSSAGSRLLYCKVCGVACVRRNEPPIRCPAGHPLTFD